MLEKVKEYALEKYAGDESMAEEFVKGFVKAAARGGPPGAQGIIASAIKPQRGPMDHLGEGFTNAIGKGLGGVVLGLGINAVSGAMKNIHQSTLHTEFLSALERAISSNAILREAKKEKVYQYAETIFKFAPHVAGDPNLLSSILANAIHGEGIDPMTIRTLSDLEGRYVDNTNAGGFSPKTYV